MTCRIALAVVSLSVACGAASVAQTPPVAEFQRWARAHAVTISFDERSLAEANIDQFAPLKASVGNAHLIALGEPFHGGHEPLDARNRLVRYCIARLGCTAVALETGFSNSKRLYDYVLGRSTESDSAIKTAFSYGFGGIKENIDLLHWLRDYNASQSAGKKVRLYGIDITGALFDPFGFRSLQSVLTYLGHTDTTLAHEESQALAEVLPVFRSDSLPLLPAERQDRIAGKVSDLETLLRLHRLELLHQGSADDYEWAV
ncbi:MAG TPA: erythromycin esterase family protein, partial [Gemmatimonadales bacterium]